MQKLYIIIGFILVATAGAVILQWTELVAWANDNPNMAAWVQAFGSIGAIWIAAWAVSRSHALETHQNKLDEFDALTQVLEGVFQLVGGAAQVARKIFDLEILMAMPHQQNCLLSALSWMQSQTHLVGLIHCDSIGTSSSKPAWFQK